MAYAKRTDANQSLVVDALRRSGMVVWITSGLGGGFPDLVAAKNGVNYLFEVKDGRKPPSAQKLTEAEKNFFDIWPGHVQILRSVEDVMDFMRTINCKG